MEGRDGSERPAPLHQDIPVRPYRLAVGPTARGKSAVRAVLQGLHQGKEIEIITPVFARGSTSKPAIAIWDCRDGSLAVVQLDFQSEECVIFGTHRRSVSTTSSTRLS